MSNRAQLLLICQAVKPLLDRFVLVGGCATELLITTITASEPRPTDDVDMVVEIVNLSDYYELSKQMRQLGFSQTADDHGVICRWRKDHIKLDLMPSESKILGFSNSWYPLAITSADVIKFGDYQIRVIRPAVFICTKLEAFNSRGRNNFLSSHDLEDLVAVIDGRHDIIDEIKSSPESVQGFLKQQFESLLTNSEFQDALPGHLPPDPASQERLPLLLEKLNHIKLT